MSSTLAYLHRDRDSLSQRVVPGATITAVITTNTFLTRSLIALLSGVNLSRLIILIAY